MGKQSAPDPVDPVKAYQGGIKVYEQELPGILKAETDARATYDPQSIQHQQDLQSQFGPTQYSQMLDSFKQLDPTYYANREALGSAIGEGLGQGFLPGEENQIESYVRAGQAARGNIYGNAAGTAEAYYKGDRLRQIKQQGISNALGYAAAPTMPQLASQVPPVSADRSLAFSNPNAGYQGQNFALQNYQNILGAQTVANSGNPWASALGGAASGAALGTSISPGWGTAIGAVAGGLYGGLGG